MLSSKQIATVIMVVVLAVTVWRQSLAAAPMPMQVVAGECIPNETTPDGKWCKTWKQLIFDSPTPVATATSVPPAATSTATSTATATATATAVPPTFTATVLPIATSSPTSTSTLIPAPTATPVPPQVNCGTGLQASIDAAAVGSVLDLTGCTYNSNPITINKVITVIGPSVTFPVTTNTFSWSVGINASNVTLDGWKIRQGGIGMAFSGSWTNITIKNSDFRDYSGGPIFMWGPVRNVLIEGNTITNTKNIQSGFVGGRGNEGANPCPAVAKDIIIRNNTGDQNTNGWFGIELKCFEDVVIEGNNLRGGKALISLPDSNRVLIRGNTLYVTRNNAYWGVEIAKAHNITVENNTFIGDSANCFFLANGQPSVGCWGSAVSQNSGSLLAVMRNNMVTNIYNAFQGSQAGYVITGNCLSGVLRVTELGTTVGATILNNGPCSQPPFTAPQTQAPIDTSIMSSHPYDEIRPPNTGSGGLWNGYN